MKVGFRTGLATLMHLLAYSLLGTVTISLWVTLVTGGLSTIWFLGLGLLFFALVALMHFAVAWFEFARNGALYHESFPMPTMRQSDRTDWLRIPMTLLLQFADARVWRGIAMHLITALLGAITAVAVVVLPASIGILIAGLISPNDLVEALWFDATRWGVLLGASIAILVSLGIMFAAVVLHRALAYMLIIPSNEERLRAEADTAWDRRADAVRAAQVERTRLERDLHDGVQPRLVSVGMTLGLAKQKLHDDPEGAAALIDEAHGSTKLAITELRQLARGYQPAVLEDRGLDAALSALAAQSRVPVQLDLDLPGRYPREVESAVYFAIAEALTNAVKHARATRIRVAAMTRGGQRLWARVEDNGVGGAIVQRGGGLDGVGQRIAAAGGTLSITSPAGGPTTLEVSVPCAF